MGRAAPLISVLLPVRDAGEWLAAAVSDVLAQRDVHLELVAVDDGSRDGSAQRLEQWARADRRVRCFAGPALGPARALDRALAEARGGLIAQMEADDRCPPTRLCELADALRAEPAWQGVTSQAAIFGARRPGMARWIEWQNGLLDGAAMAAARFLEIPALHQSGLYRREALLALGGFCGDPRWPLDIDFWMRWHERGFAVGKLARRLYCWRQHARQSTRTSPLHQPDPLRRCKAHYFARGPGHGRPIELLGVGQTLLGWRAALAAEGRGDALAHAWRPGAPLPPAQRGGCRLFLFGTAGARRRVEAQLGPLPAGEAWFAA